MHEIIHVVELESPAGDRRRGLEIEAVDGRPLAAGYYFVLWSSRVRRPDECPKRYFGPFASRAQARLLQTSAVALGLAGNGEAIQAIAECRSIVRRRTPALPEHPGARVFGGRRLTDLNSLPGARF